MATQEWAPNPAKKAIPRRLVQFEGQGLSLLFFTWLLELPGVGVRWLLMMILLLPVSVLRLFFDRWYWEVVYSYTFVIEDPFQLIAVYYNEYTVPVLLLAAFPLVLSILSATVLPGGSLLTRFALGARTASKREREAIQAALSQIGAKINLSHIKSPSNWFVIDSPTPNAYVVGTTLYVTRELLRNDHLTAVVAHELGHINSYDGRMVMALRRLVIPPVHYLSQLIRQPAPGNMVMIVAPDPLQAYIQITQVWLFSLFLSLVGGGFGLWALSPLWIWYWRKREYNADEFAAYLGFGSELIEYLEEYQFFDVATPYFLSSHPYTELRIDRLQQMEAQRSTLPNTPAAATATPTAQATAKPRIAQQAAPDATKGLDELVAERRGEEVKKKESRPPQKQAPLQKQAVSPYGSIEDELRAALQGEPQVKPGVPVEKTTLDKEVEEFEVRYEALLNWLAENETNRKFSEEDLWEAFKEYQRILQRAPREQVLEQGAGLLASFFFVLTTRDLLLPLPANLDPRRLSLAKMHNLVDLEVKRFRASGETTSDQRVKNVKRLQEMLVVYQHTLYHNQQEALDREDEAYLKTLTELLLICPVP